MREDKVGGGLFEEEGVGCLFVFGLVDLIGGEGCRLGLG